MREMSAARHPNDPTELRRRLAADVLALTAKDRSELVHVLDEALAQLPGAAVSAPDTPISA